MTNSISTTVDEVRKNINDTVIMAKWQPMSKPTTWQFNFILCQVVKDTDRLWCYGLCQDVITKTF